MELCDPFVVSLTRSVISVGLPREQHDEPDIAPACMVSTKFCFIIVEYLTVLLKSIIRTKLASEGLTRPAIIQYHNIPNKDNLLIRTDAPICPSLGVLSSFYSRPMD